VRVDFYHLTRDPAEKAALALARKALADGERLLLVSADPAQRARISEALWSHSADSFLPHGEAGEGHEERQPVLLSDEPHALNGGRYLLIADGQWREGELPFERVFFLFDEETKQGARGVWRRLRDAGGRELHYWSQEGGRWVEAG
jgi:DNA polymerase-3 subunit chi